MSSRQKKNNPQQKNPASDEEEEVYDDGGEVNKEKDQMNKTSKSKASQKSQQQYTPDGNQPEKIISAIAYLEQNVTSVLQEGMLELVKEKPDNPLEYLGNFILQRAKNYKQ